MHFLRDRWAWAFFGGLVLGIIVTISIWEVFGSNHPEEIVYRIEMVNPQ